MTKKLSIRIVQWHPGRRQPAIERLLSGSAETGAVDETVRAGLQDVRVRGDAAVAEGRLSC